MQLVLFGTIRGANKKITNKVRQGQEYENEEEAVAPA